MSCPSRLGLFKRIPIRKRGQPSTTIKAPIPSQIEVRIIYPSLALYSCENSSNLTFGGYSASTTPILSARSSFFIVQTLFRVCKCHMAHWWYLRLHQVILTKGTSLEQLAQFLNEDNNYLHFMRWDSSFLMCESLYTVRLIFSHF